MVWVYELIEPNWPENVDGGRGGGGGGVTEGKERNIGGMEAELYRECWSFR